MVSYWCALALSMEQINPLLLVPDVGLTVVVRGEGVSTDEMGLIIAIDAEETVIGRSISKYTLGHNLSAHYRPILSAIMNKL